MNQFNNIVTPLNSMRGKRYIHPYTQTLNNQNNYKSRRIFPYSNIPLYKKNSLFLQNKLNNTESMLNNSISKTVSNISHISHLDYHTDSNKIREITEYGNKINNKKHRKNCINKNANNKIQKDLEMMKLQMSCDIVTHKINQIKDKVQNLHESSIEEDKNLINKKIGINVYQKKKSDNMKFYSIKNLNNNYNRYVFNDFSKEKNKKFLRISKEMSREINNTFDNSELNHIDDKIKTYQDYNLNLDIYRNKPYNRIPKFSYTNNLKYFAIDTQNNSKDIFNNNNNDIYQKDNFEIRSNTLNNIDKIENLKYINSNNNNNIKKYVKNNNKIIRLNKDSQRIKTNKINLTESNIIKPNHISNINDNLDNKDKNKIYNKLKLIENKNKNKFKENNKQTQQKNNFEFFNPKFGSLDKYFINNNLNKKKNINNINNQIEKNINLYNDNNQYNISKNNKEIKTENDLNQNNENNKIKIEDNNINDEKLLLYSNLEQSKQGNLNLNKYYKKNLNKNNLYIKLQNKDKNEIDNKIVKNKLNDINKEKYNSNGENIYYNYFKLKNDNITTKDKNDKIDNKKELNNSENILNTNNNLIQPNNNMINNKDNIKDNNFKININNIANYSIKNNCLNINNNTNKNKLIEDNNTNNIDESNVKDKAKLTHNYSKDDLLLTSEKINLEYSPDELLEKNSVNAENNSEIIKRNLTFEKDDIILDPIAEESISNNINKKNSKKKNIFIMPIRTQYKHKDKKVKIKHKELCHKFTDNPQQFFTVKLNEMMLKALNINNIKGINIKK